MRVRAKTACYGLIPHKNGVAIELAGVTSGRLERAQASPGSGRAPSALFLLLRRMPTCGHPLTPDDQRDARVELETGRGGSPTGCATDDAQSHRASRRNDRPTLAGLGRTAGRGLRFPDRTPDGGRFCTCCKVDRPTTGCLPRPTRRPRAGSGVPPPANREPNAAGPNISRNDCRPALERERGLLRESRAASWFHRPPQAATHSFSQRLGLPEQQPLVEGHQRREFALVPGKKRALGLLGEQLAQSLIFRGRRAARSRSSALPHSTTARDQGR